MSVSYSDMILIVFLEMFLFWFLLGVLFSENFFPKCGQVYTQMTQDEKLF